MQIKNPNLHILVDADSCPVKQEIYKIAHRNEVSVSIVSNGFIQTPTYNIVKLVLINSNNDAAEDYIAENANEKSVVITADILLADRCLKKNATVIAPNGRPFTVNSIGSAVASRALSEDLMASGEITGGPPPFSQTDRSKFLDSLHNALTKLR